jgi:hypothetical protein
VRGFEEKRDRASYQLVGARWGGGPDAPYFRFVRLKEAEAKFAEMLALPQYAKEANYALLKREERKERIKALIDAGKMSLFRRKAQ